eukprot:Colp12_sorted_trinity150504_noHs@21527
MKVAVVGGGMAGLTTAWHLGSQNVEVDLYEKQGDIGLGAHKVTLDVKGEQIDIDIPARVLIPGYYKELMSLYREVGINFEYIDNSTSFSICSGESFGAVLFRHMNVLFDKYSLPYVPLKNLFSWSFLGNVSEWFRLRSTLHQHYMNGALDNITIGQFLCQAGFSSSVGRDMLLPMLATMLTCSCDEVSDLPAKYVADIMLCMLLKPHALMRASGGMRTAIARLAKNLTNVHLNSTVQGVYPAQNGEKSYLVHN